MSTSSPDPPDLDPDDEGPEGYVEERDGHPEGGMPQTRMMPWLSTRRRMTRDAALRLQVRCGYRPLRWQVAAHRAGRPHRGTVAKLGRGGMGSGKTTWGGRELGGVVLMLPGGHHLVTAPTYDQVRRVCVPAYQAAVSQMQRRGYPISLRGVRPTSMVDDLVCGGQVFFRSYSKVGNLLGFEFSSLWLDELDTIMRAGETLDTLETRLRQRWTMDGWELPWRQTTVTTTPRGWTGACLAWRRAHAAGDDAVRHAHYQIHATYKDNPFLPDGYGERLATRMSAARYRRDVLAEIDAPDDVVLPEYEPGKHGVEWGVGRERWDPQLPYWITWDGGDSRPSILVLQPGLGGAVICDELAEDCSRERQRAWILDVVRRFGRNPAAISMDRALKSDRQWIRETLRLEPAYCQTWAQQDVHEGLERVRALLDPAVGGPPRLYVARHLQRQCGERGIHVCLQRYRWMMRSDGTPSPNPMKDNVHDHAIDALRYWAVMVGVDGDTREVRVWRPRGREAPVIIG